MTVFLTVLHVLVCLIIIVVVLLQRGKGADIGAVFGGGGSSTVFGSRGAGNFLTKITTGAAVVFMLTSLSLAYFAEKDTRSTLFEEEGAAVEESSPFAEPTEVTPEDEGDGFSDVSEGDGADETESFEEIPVDGATDEGASENP